MNCSSKTGRFPYAAKTAGDAENGRFRQRRIVNLFRKFSGKFLRQAKHAALRIFDVFAENDAARDPSRVRPAASCSLCRRSDICPAAKFRRSIRGDFPRDFEVQLVGDGSSAFSASAYSLPNALFDFVVHLGELVRRDHAFLDQLFFPAFERIAFFQRFEFFRAAIKLLIVRAGVTGESLHLHPEKNRALRRRGFSRSLSRAAS